jgi:hypothetical protein
MVGTKNQIMEATTRTHYIFVDYENVQDIDLDLIAEKPVKVFLIVGPQRKSLPTILARQAHRYHSQVTWIESEGASRNALDLVLAYHVGVQATADPHGKIHILAKDKDYDALIKHLRANGIQACRDESFAVISVFAATKLLSLADRPNWVLERFQKTPSNRPKRKTRLLSSIHALFQKRLLDTEVEQIVTELIRCKHIAITPQGAVTYLI